MYTMEHANGCEEGDHVLWRPVLVDRVGYQVSRTKGLITQDDVLKNS